jgi:hypothetical protein
LGRIISKEEIQGFFWKYLMERILIEDFIMDKTKFGKSESYRYAVLIAGSKSVWIYCAESNCHFTITACVSASGLVISPFLWSRPDIDLILPPPIDHESIEVVEIVK